MATASSHQTRLKQYFTDAPEVNATMAELLGSIDGLTVLEPSVGSGALLAGLNGSPDHLDAVDVDSAVLAVAKRRYSSIAMEPHCLDFIDVFVDGLMLASRSPLRRDYDAVISNPPFGLFLSPEYRKKLKAAFPELYVRESYGLFLYFSILLLKDGGRYVFLLPDTFLTSTNHSSLRRFIFEAGEPSHVIRFPSKRFETVNFGYGNLCIIAGHKRPASHDTSLTWVEAFDERLPLLDQPPTAVFSVAGGDLQAHVGTGWRVGMGEERSETQGWTTLGELADCKTGIYTGDNGRFIGYDPARISRRLNGHSISWDRVLKRDLAPEEQRDGVADKEAYVPLIRGGHRPFAEETAWAIRWGKDAISFYRTDKKARLQNSAYYFRAGIAVPMVTSRRLSASLMDKAVFDQGVVGVFPRVEASREAILLYLNSSIATRLRNEMLNGSANNSANYLKRLPAPVFTRKDYEEARSILSRANKGGALPLEICDAFVNQFITTADKRLDPLAGS
jgi:adenine-specific DNA-methyltransferase